MGMGILKGNFEINSIGNFCVLSKYCPTIHSDRFNVIAGVKHQNVFSNAMTDTGSGEITDVAVIHTTDFFMAHPFYSSILHVLKVVYTKRQNKST